MMEEASKAVGQLRAAVPRIDGLWNHLPITGVPAVGLMFAGGWNNIADTWSDCAEILLTVLKDDGELLVTVAKNYRAANHDAEAATDQLRH
ncbi:hypothetical protein ABZ297_14715 [Nonomuraea sp. NPDC005983]|uniref:hypothetical protein n=1 Tax=Nonomuraea sp. NPDC005983 TaxID=3155595 RepID=UPI0033A742D7